MCEYFYKFLRCSRRGNVSWHVACWLALWVNKRKTRRKYSNIYKSFSHHVKFLRISTRCVRLENVLTGCKKLKFFHATWGAKERSHAACDVTHLSCFFYMSGNLKIKSRKSGKLTVQTLMLLTECCQAGILSDLLGQRPPHLKGAFGDFAKGDKRIIWYNRWSLVFLCFDRLWFVLPIAQFHSFHLIIVIHFVTLFFDCALSTQFTISALICYICV